MLNKMKVAALNMVPSALSPENQYAKSFAAVLCLAVSADMEFDFQEFSQASVFIENDAFLRHIGLTQRANEFFKMYCDQIQKVMQQGNVMFPSVQTEMIAEARNVPAEFRSELKKLVEQLRPMCSGVEITVLNRIAL